MRKFKDTHTFIRFPLTKYIGIYCFSCCSDLTKAFNRIVNFYICSSQLDMSPDREWAQFGQLRSDGCDACGINLMIS